MFHLTCIPDLYYKRYFALYSVTYRQRLNDQPNSLAKSLLQRPNYKLRLKRYDSADLASRCNSYRATTTEIISNHLRLRLNRRCTTGRISYILAQGRRTPPRILHTYQTHALTSPAISAYVTTVITFQHPRTDSLFSYIFAQHDDEISTSANHIVICLLDSTFVNLMMLSE